MVADDGSADVTLEIVERFSDRFPGQVVVLDTEPVGSAKANFFRLLRQAPAADYTALCDQDDVWTENKLAVLVGACQDLERDYDASTPCLVHSDLKVVDADLGVLAESFMQEIRTNPGRVTFASNIVENHVPGCSALVNRALVSLFRTYAGPLDDAIMHDWWLSMLARGSGQVRFLPEPLVSYRQHSTNTMGSVHRGGLRFILSKLRSLGAGDAADTRRQAAAFERAYGYVLAPEPAHVLGVYAGLARSGKVRRVWLCVRTGLLKQTVGRRFYQLIRI